MAKPPISEEEMARLRANSHEAALVLADDLQHIRGIVGREEPSAGDLRRLSSVLRRILIDGDLRKIATPRVGKIEIVGPDLRVFYRENEKVPFALLAADRFKTHGIEFSAFVVENRASPRPLPGYEPDARVSLRTEPFQNQKVLCVKGRWVTRADIIKYVANVAHGIHSGTARTEIELIIRNIRRAMDVTMGEAGPHGELGPIIRANIDAIASEDAPIRFDPSIIDLPLLNLLSTAQFVTASPDVIQLENAIKANG